MKHMIEVELPEPPNVPEGWHLVDYRFVKMGERYSASKNCWMDWECDRPSALPDWIIASNPDPPRPLNFFAGLGYRLTGYRPPRKGQSYWSDDIGAICLCGEDKGPFESRWIVEECAETKPAQPESMSVSFESELAALLARYETEHGCGTTGAAKFVVAVLNALADYNDDVPF